MTEWLLTNEEIYLVGNGKTPIEEGKVMAQAQLRKVAQFLKENRHLRVARITYADGKGVYCMIPMEKIDSLLKEAGLEAE